MGGVHILVAIPAYDGIVAGTEIVLGSLMTFWSSITVALVWGTYRRLDARIDRLETRLDRLEVSLDARIDRLENEIAHMRADLTQIALAVGAARRPEATGA